MKDSFPKANAKSSPTKGSRPRKTTRFGSKDELEKSLSEMQSVKDTGSLFQGGTMGVQFNDWTLTDSRIFREQGHRKVMVVCKCGLHMLNYLDALLAGTSPRCEKCRAENRKSRYPMWLAARFYAAKERCENPLNPQFNNYGGRGIRFRFESAGTAAAWMMENHGLQKEKEIDRVNNNGHYEPDNMRWASKSDQMRNNRRTKIPEGFKFQEEQWPLSRDITERMLRKGLTREEILAHAASIVSAKKKNWRQIAERFARTTSSTPDLATASPCRDAL